MEPQAALAVPRENQEMEINVTCHGLQALQVGVSKVLDIPLHKITCRVKRLGK
jgi:xanthine dehydrogenase molybdopterin-binding subunit B